MGTRLHPSQSCQNAIAVWNQKSSWDFSQIRKIFQSIKLSTGTITLADSLCVKIQVCSRPPNGFQDKKAAQGTHTPALAPNNIYTRSGL